MNWDKEIVIFLFVLSILHVNGIKLEGPERRRLGKIVNKSTHPGEVLVAMETLEEGPGNTTVPPNPFDFYDDENDDSKNGYSFPGAGHVEAQEKLVLWYAILFGLLLIGTCVHVCTRRAQGRENLGNQGNGGNQENQENRGNRENWINPENRAIRESGENEAPVFEMVQIGRRAGAEQDPESQCATPEPGVGRE